MKKLLFGLILFFACWQKAYATTLTGTIKNPDGSGFTGQMYFWLSQQGALISTGGCGGPSQVVPVVRILFTITNGSITSPASPQVFGNDCMTPVNTFYNVQLIQNGVIILQDEWQISGASIDIGTIISALITGVGIPNVVLTNPTMTQTVVQPGGTVLAITGAFSVSGLSSLGTLTTTGLATLNSLSVVGNSSLGGTLSVTGPATLSSTLGVTGNTTLSGTLGVTGNTTLTTLTATDITARSYANTGQVSQYTGADWAAKANACFTFKSRCEVDSSAGTSATTALTIPAGKLLVFRDTSVYTTSAGVTLHSGSVMQGVPFGDGNAIPCSSGIGSCLLAAASSNQAALVTVAVGATAAKIQDMLIDGNKGNNTTGGVGVFINKATKVVISHSSILNTPSHALEILSTVSNESCCGQIIDTTLAGANGDCAYVVLTGDTFFVAGDQLENCGIKAVVNTDGSGVATYVSGTNWTTDSASLVGTMVSLNGIPCQISAVSSTTFSTNHCQSSVASLTGATVLWGGGAELSDSAGVRIQTSDVGGGIEFGIAGYGLGGATGAVNETITGNNIGNQYGHDIMFLGNGIGDNLTFTAGENTIQGNTFIGHTPSGVSNTFDSVYMRDTQNDVVSGNIFSSTGGATTRDYIHVVEHTSGVSSNEVLGSNVYAPTNIGTAAIACGTANSGANCYVPLLESGNPSTWVVPQVEQWGSAAGCATGATVGANCQTFVNFPTSFIDSTYQFSCSCVGFTSGVPVIGVSAVTSSSQVSQTIVAVTAAAAQCTNVVCRAVHH